jgi:alkylhydroperoxidase family enzyme
MANIKPAYPLDDKELADLSPSQRLSLQNVAILAHRPALAEHLLGLAAALSGDASTLPKRLVELVRLRIAFYNQCRSCMSVRYAPDVVDESLVCSLERPEVSEDLTEAEKASLRFAELMATDHLAIDAAVYEGLREHFTEEQLVELSMHCAQYVGFGRMTATWGLHEHLHERFQKEQDQAYTPWGGGALY